MKNHGFTRLDQGHSCDTSLIQFPHRVKGKYTRRSAWDWAVALLPMLSWLRTYNIKGWLVVRPNP